MKKVLLLIFSMLLFIPTIYAVENEEYNQNQTLANGTYLDVNEYQLPDFTDNNIYNITEENAFTLESFGYFLNYLFLIIVFFVIIICIITNIFRTKILKKKDNPFVYVVIIIGSIFLIAITIFIIGKIKKSRISKDTITFYSETQMYGFLKPGNNNKYRLINNYSELLEFKKEIEKWHLNQFQYDIYTGELYWIIVNGNKHIVDRDYILKEFTKFELGHIKYEEDNRKKGYIYNMEVEEAYNSLSSAFKDTLGYEAIEKEVLKKIDKYDEEYFKNNSLLLIDYYAEQMSSADTYTKNIKVNNSKLDIELYVDSYYGSIKNNFHKLIFAEVERGNEQIKDVNLKINHIIN